MANDIIDINVYETVETVEITVNPNLTTVNINKVTGGGGGGSQDLQSVTDIGATTTNTITANSITTTIDSTINGVRVGRGNLASSTSNTAVGYQALQSNINTTGSEGRFNTAFGSEALKTLTTGYLNDAFGQYALRLCTTGTLNLAVGNSAMANSITATQNTAVGQYALQNSISGQKNTAIGLGALNQNTASFNTAIGSYAGGIVSSTGTENILVGYQAGGYISSGRNNLLIENVGSNASITSGSYNIILNPKQRSGVTTGSNNTIIGCFDNTFATGLTSNVIIANGLGSIRFQSTDTGLTTVPAQTNTLINGDATGKAVVTKEYLSNSQTVFVPYTGATTDVNLGLNDITAEKLIKSGGTSSQILAADGDVITAGNNITITGGKISSIGGGGRGGSSVNYYLNGGTSQGTFGGSTYYEFSKTAIIGTGADFNINTNGYIASFITDVADPSLLLIPAGNWNLEFFFSSSSAGGSPSFYVELYKYDGTTFTSIASSSATPEGITGGTAIDAYFTPLAVPETVLTVNDRLAIRVFVNASSKTITLHTQNGHLCEVITTFTTGLTALNGLQAQVQNFATGTTGTDFAINSSGSTHTFNLPSASATARGVVTTSSQTFAGDKTFTGTIVASSIGSNAITGNSTNEIGVIGNSVSNAGVSGTSTNDAGVAGTSVSGIGIGGLSDNNNGVLGVSVNEIAGVFNAINGATIVEFHKNSVTKAKIDSDGLITGTGLNASGQTINTIASFDANKNVVSLPTATYPSLTELALVKGVSGSSIQTQLNGKQDTLQSTVNIKSINGTSILGSGDLTISGTGISSLNGLTGATQTFSVFTNFTGSPSFVSTGTNHQLKLPNAGPSTDYGLVTNGSQFIGGTKQFTSNPEIPVPAGNSGSCIVLGTTGGGGATGTLQIGSTTLYPTALEMQYVKGITSSVQTQLDSKASIVANITNDIYSGTIVWTGGAAPTVPNHTYSLSQIGNLVTLTINLAYTTAGSSLLTGVAMELPSTAPAPALPSSATAALDVINYGSGALQILNDSPTAAFANNTLLRIKSTGVYEVFITRGAGQFRHAYATIQYFV